jgi:peptidyl-prolyl cis-trans isomerase D
MQMEGMYDEAWQIFLNSKLFENQYVELGMGVYNPYFDIIGVTNEEIMDRVVGENIDREILMNFTNPQTGQFDKQMLIQILSRLQEYKESDPRFTIVVRVRKVVA